MVENESDEEMADDEEYYIEGAGYIIEMRNTVHVEDNDGDIEVFSEYDDADGDVEEELRHRAGDIWHTSEPFHYHQRERNIVNAVSRNLAHPCTEIESFLLFVNEDMLQNVQTFHQL